MTLLDTYRGDVEDALDAGAPFDAVETMIDGAPGLTADARAALWLLAWARVDRAAQRQLAVAHLDRIAVEEACGTRPRRRWRLIRG
jgi:hypothetical protein